MLQNYLYFIIRSQMIHNIKDQLVQKYIEIAVDVILKKPNQHIGSLNQKQRVLITKIMQNINRICKLNKKQVIQMLKSYPSYQPVLSQLYFQQTLNDWRLITNDQCPQHTAIALNKISEQEQCIGVQYRIQFTLSSISKKKIMKPVILFVFFLASGTQFKVYFNLAQFSKFRYQIANAMKSIYAIQMKTLF